MNRLILVFAMAFSLTAVAGLPAPAQAGTRVRVEAATGGGWQWQVDGRPFTVQGAAHVDSPQGLALLAAAGATTVRTYGTDGAWVLDAADRLGLKVIMGLDMTPARLGFPYTDPKAVAEQRAQMVAFVAAHKNHPALLAWGIGNEVELSLPDTPPGRVPPEAVVWQVLDAAAAAVKAEDPNHPTMMVIADGSREHFARADTCCASIDLLGVNVYGDSALSLAGRMAPGGMRKPVVITEMGPLGQWQAGATPWGAPGEPTSSDKAAWFRRAWPDLRRQPALAGAFAFLWGAKQEATRTWHGLLLADGTPLTQADALAEAWSGPASPFLRNHAPEIRGIGMNTAKVAPGGALSAGVDAIDLDGDALRVEWAVVAEASGPALGGLPEPPPPEIKTTFAPATEGVGVLFPAPTKPGAYRLFITVRDVPGVGLTPKAATANLPFLVE